MELTPLAQYGVVGISIALIALVYACVKFLYKIVCNHINHNNAIMTKLTIAIDELVIYVRKNNGHK